MTYLTSVAEARSEALVATLPAGYVTELGNYFFSVRT
jgi:hypothetical protein